MTDHDYDDSGDEPQGPSEAAAEQMQEKILQHRADNIARATSLAYGFINKRAELRDYNFAGDDTGRIVHKITELALERDDEGERPAQTPGAVRGQWQDHLDAGSGGYDYVVGPGDAMADEDGGPAGLSPGGGGITHPTVDVARLLNDPEHPLEKAPHWVAEVAARAAEVLMQAPADQEAGVSEGVPFQFCGMSYITDNQYLTQESDSMQVVGTDTSQIYLLVSTDTSTNQAHSAAYFVTYPRSMPPAATSHCEPDCAADAVCYEYHHDSTGAGAVARERMREMILGVAKRGLPRFSNDPERRYLLVEQEVASAQGLVNSEHKATAVLTGIVLQQALKRARRYLKPDETGPQTYGPGETDTMALLQRVGNKARQIAIEARNEAQYGQQVRGGQTMAESGTTSWTARKLMVHTVGEASMKEYLDAVREPIESLNDWVKQIETAMSKNNKRSRHADAQMYQMAFMNLKEYMAGRMAPATGHIAETFKPIYMAAQNGFRLTHLENAEKLQAAQNNPQQLARPIRYLPYARDEIYDKNGRRIYGVEAIHERFISDDNAIQMKVTFT